MANAKAVRTRLEREWERNSYHHNLKLAQKQLNKLVRMENAGPYGDCECVCCRRLIHWKQCDAGHFISATRSATRFLYSKEISNIHPQCKHCNQFDTTSDSAIKYSLFMADEYGRDAVELLMAQSREPKKWERDEVIDLRQEWAERIKIQTKRLEGVT